MVREPCEGAVRVWSGADCRDIYISQSDVSRYGALHAATDRINADFLSDHVAPATIANPLFGVAVAAASWASLLQHVFDSPHVVSPLLSLPQAERTVGVWDFCFVADVCGRNANVGGVTDPEVARSKQEQRCDWNEARMRLASAHHWIKRACNSPSINRLMSRGENKGFGAVAVILSTPPQSRHPHPHFEAAR